MRVQIAICTWNRASLLDQTLNQMRQLEIPDGIEAQWIIVDNASTDGTSEVISHYADAFSILSLREEIQGHTHARNRAISAIDGDLLIWTDDDVLVDRSWVKHYVEAARQDTEMTFWGGPITPKFMDHRPNWIKENWSACKGCFALRDLGESPREFDDSTLPYGANFAVRSAAQKQFPFDTELGRKGHEVSGGDEIDLLRRLIGNGHRGRWIPNAKVAHLIPPERTSEGYVRDYFVGQGRIEALQNWRSAGSKSSLRREAWVQRFLYRLKRPYAPSPVWFTHMVRAALATGKLQGLCEATQDEFAG